MTRLLPHRPYQAPGVLRLDSLVNPYAPTDAVGEALADIDLNTTPDDRIANGLRRRLAGMAGVDERWVVLGNGIDELYAGIVRWRLDSGPVAVFPPSHLRELQRVLDLRGDVHVVPRTAAFGLGLSTTSRRFPENATSVVMSPNDPTGTLVDLHDLVRLSRQSAIVVVDERHGAYTPRTTAHLAREFENVIVLQSMEWWGGLVDYPIAWAICPPSLGQPIREAMTGHQLDRAALIAAQATLDDWVWLHGTLRRLTMEKGRLFRQLRKLNMLHTPHLSWANFVLTSFARGGVDYFVPRLEEQGIHVFVPDQDILPGSIRVSAVSAEATDQLKRALIEIALEL
ncbi:MAG TPA: aminotransferase class I/II-fold pyridoxal phosphate-dependent enzyme [Thermomicrobiales bacterium]|nr:aminotransferase class I/II-fold pyridoxal phosphate-dependent enzyme [Thermomicrobiales bacterium]